jgi:hypothetical protein
MSPLSLKLRGSMRLQPHFVKNLTSLGPRREHAGGIGRLGAADVLVLVVFLGSPDHPVLDNVFYDLLYY